MKIRPCIVVDNSGFPLMQVYVIEDSLRLCSVPLNELERDAIFRHYLESRSSDDLNKIRKYLNHLKETNPNDSIFVGYSTSRRELWPKGLTSGNIQIVRDIRVHAPQLIEVSVVPVGPACHTDQYSCFFRKIKGAYPRDIMNRADFKPEECELSKIDYNAIQKRFPEKTDVVPAVFFDEKFNIQDFRYMGTEEVKRLYDKCQLLLTDCDYDSLVVI
ncbi:MAG: phosphoribosyl-AMP cyclohydrolase [Candidatus Aenigmatarchaeota archaeon]